MRTPSLSISQSWSRSRRTWPRSTIASTANPLPQRPVGHSRPDRRSRPKLEAWLVRVAPSARAKQGRGTRCPGALYVARRAPVASRAPDEPVHRQRGASGGASMPVTRVTATRDKQAPALDGSDACFHEHGAVSPASWPVLDAPAPGRERQSQPTRFPRAVATGTPRGRTACPPPSRST